MEGNSPFTLGTSSCPKQQTNPYVPVVHIKNAVLKAHKISNILAFKTSLGKASEVMLEALLFLKSSHHLAYSTRFSEANHLSDFQLDHPTALA